MRQIVKSSPFPGPNRATASIAYWEQEGEKRQEGRISGEKK